MLKELEYFCQIKMKHEVTFFIAYFRVATSYDNRLRLSTRIYAPRDSGARFVFSNSVFEPTDSSGPFVQHQDGWPDFRFFILFAELFKFKRKPAVSLKALIVHQRFESRLII